MAGAGGQGQEAGDQEEEVSRAFASPSDLALPRANASADASSPHDGNTAPSRHCPPQPAMCHTPHDSIRLYLGLSQQSALTYLFLPECIRGGASILECRKWNVEKSKEMRVHHLFRVQSVNSVRCVHRRACVWRACARRTSEARARPPPPPAQRAQAPSQAALMVHFTYISLVKRSKELTRCRPQAASE